MVIVKQGFKMPEAIRKKETRDYGLITVFIFIFVFIFSFALINILKFRAFSSTSFGWAYMHVYPKLANFSNPFDIFILPEFNILIFLAPLNYLLAFVYNIVPKPEVLLVFQEIIMAVGAVPIYLIARDNLKGTFLAVSIALAYLLHPIITTGGMLGYTPLALGMPFFLFALYYLEKENLGKFTLFIILANLSKIDNAVITIIMGVVLILSKKKKKYGQVSLKIGIITFSTMAIITLIYLKMVNRSFPVGLVHFNNYGNNFSDALSYSLSNPLSIFRNLFNHGNMLYSIFFVLPNIFSFLSPLNLFPIIPEMAYVLIRNQHSTGHFMILAFVFVGSIYGLKKMIRFISPILNWFKMTWLNHALLARVLAVLILIPFLIRHYYIKAEFDFSSKLGPVPFTRDFYFGYYNLDEHSLVGNRLLKMVPLGATCLTLQSLAGHMGRCRYIAPLESCVISEDYAWEYVFVDLYKDDLYHISKEKFLLYLRQLITQGKYGVMVFDDGWVLLKRGYALDKNKYLLNQVNQLIGS